MKFFVSLCMVAHWCLAILVDANTLTIVVDNQYQLYIDNVQYLNIPNQYNCHLGSSTITIPDTFSVIAIQGWNSEGPAGLVAYDADGLVTTSTDWKCSTNPDNGWQTTDFDDSSWPSATISDWQCSTLPSNVVSIWTEGLLANNSYAYCRKKIGQVAQNALTITADDQYALYVDGVQFSSLANSDKCYANDVIPLPHKFSVIAVQVYNQIGQAGIVAYDTMGLVQTSTAWKCSSTPVYGWQMVDFDDSSWQNAALSDWTCSPLASNIQPIWTQGPVQNISYAYCRMKIRLSSTEIYSTTLPPSLNICSANGFAQTYFWNGPVIGLAAICIIILLFVGCLIFFFKYQEALRNVSRPQEEKPPVYATLDRSLPLGNEYKTMEF